MCVIESCWVNAIATDTGMRRSRRYLIFNLSVRCVALGRNEWNRTNCLDLFQFPAIPNAGITSQQYISPLGNLH